MLVVTYDHIWSHIEKPVLALKVEFLHEHFLAWVGAFSIFSWEVIFLARRTCKRRAR